MKVTNNQFNPEGYFTNPSDDIRTLVNKDSVQLHDQNGYHLTEAEQAFLNPNGYEIVERRMEDCIRQDWLVWDSRDKAHINHSDLFERKGFKGEALEQLEHFAEKDNPMLWKVAKMKPKWGIDISIDYVSRDKVFEVFHYEWDAFEFDLVQEKKEELQRFVLEQDWDHVAEVLWKKKDEWLNLPFFEQTKWRTDFFGLSPEKFKDVIWKN